MRKGKLGLLALMLAAGMGLLSGCGQVDETVLNSEADTTVNIAVPYATATPLPEYLDVPDPVVIDSNGNVTVNDSTLLTSHHSLTRESDSAYRTLSLGDTGLAVQSLQTRLSELGYYTAGVSGIFDAATETAVKRFEQTYGIMQTGIATPAFQTRLFAAAAVSYGSADYDTAVVSQYTTLQRGAVGSSVYALQHRLRELGYPIRELTGVYDEDTEKAVQLFYQAYGLEPQTVAYIALQKELYADNARPYTVDGQVQTVDEDETTLSAGKVGTQVMQIQNRLIALGYMHATASGIYDTETEAAVRLFEEACGVEATGRLPYALQAILLSDEAPAYGSTYVAQEKEYTVLSEGAAGDAVTALQNRLIALGYASGSGNGSYGAETAAAVKLFQRYNNLEQTGVADAATQAAMDSPVAITYQDVLNGVTSHENAQAAATPTPEPAMDTVSDMRTLSAGMTGDDVLEVQTRLNALKYDCETDGTFGEATAQAVRDFQSAIGMPQTGEVTLSLKQYLASKAAPQKGITMYKSTQTFATLRRGDTGESVTNLQKKLWELGYLLTEDVQDSIGTYHDKTAEAVAAAQRALEFAEPDGVATAELQCFLFSDYSKYIKK